MDTDNFIVHMKTKDAYANPAEDVEKRFDTSNYAVDWPSEIKVIEQMKNELVGKIMTKFVVLTLKTYNYLKHDSSDKKS